MAKYYKRYSEEQIKNIIWIWKYLVVKKVLLLNFAIPNIEKKKNLIGRARDIGRDREMKLSYACHGCYGTHIVLATKTNTD